MYIYCAQTIAFTKCRVVWTCPDLSGRSVNGICILFHQANFSEGGFAILVPLPTPFFFFLVLNFGLVGGLLHVFFFYVTGVLGGDRRNAVVAL